MAWATKFPELFFAGINYDGALHTWETLTTEMAPVNAGMPEEFNSDETNFLPYSPYLYAVVNAEEIKTSVELRSVVGLLDDKNTRFKDVLISLGIWPAESPEYIDTECNHDLECLLGLNADSPGNEAHASGKGSEMWQLLWQTMEASAEQSKTGCDDNI